jgi:predicted Zn-dependent protease
VELPFATDPEADLSDKQFDHNMNPYTKARVLQHTITHELGHALAGPMHTNDPKDLMYKHSNNWKRDDYLSDFYRSLLRIHNIKR